MREIKFRAFNFGQMRYFEKPEDFKWFFGDMDGPERTLAECNLMQYTGLKDRNGREIYEGDIVKDTDTGNIRQVLYNTPAFVLVDENRYFYWTYHADEQEVIGNIYEHPHLLDPA